MVEKSKTKNKIGKRFYYLKNIDIYLAACKKRDVAFFLKQGLSRDVHLHFRVKVQCRRDFFLKYTN